MAIGTPEERLAALEEWAIETTLHLSAMEFIVEVILANRLAARTAADTDGFVEELASPMRPAFTRQDGLGDADIIAATDRVSQHLEIIGRKAAARAALLRQSMPDADPRRFL